MKEMQKKYLVQPILFKNVKANVDKVFLKLLKKHFPASPVLHRIFKKSTVKIREGCMKNIKSVISSHNKSIWNPRMTSLGCNCRKKESFPLNGQCLKSQLVYRATVTNAANKDMKKYIRDFEHQKYCNCTELAKYVWKLKEKNIVPIIKWEILGKVYGNPKRTMFNWEALNN